MICWDLTPSSQKHFIEAEKVTKEHEVAHSEMQTGFYVLLKKSSIFWGEYS